ncbi:hypothetical protein QJS10_CPA16g00180 [Acorus calamus]|uniref:ABC transporter domain-containing protein n=1 Tax=Acorus calamus TaxID=4465 RepID=A0AAV9D1K0_ACOCL|nr:hypothetical protein QJS10_CPA16g00180 [Acorus calamus]
MSISVVSTTNSTCSALPGFHRSSLPRRFAVPMSKRSGSRRERERIVCACTTPSRNLVDELSSIDGNVRIQYARNLSVDRGVEDEADILIECKDVHKSFGEKQVLRGVSFKIRHGEAVGIIGPSGTGKSTILKIMAGLLAPDKGEVHICGRKRHGLVDDDGFLVYELAWYENSCMQKNQIAELVTETLAAVGLKGVEDLMPSELSGGMKKRVALARSIIFDNTKESIEPEVVLYDEPTAGLDPIASTVVEDLIRSVHLKGKDAMGKPGNIASYAVVTHQHSTIRRAVDR